MSKSMGRAYVEYSYSNAEEPSDENWRGISAIILKSLKFVSASSKVCEIGCGNGAFSQMLYTNGYDVVGLDASESGIAAAREKVKSDNNKSIRFECAQIEENLADILGEGQFDVVIASEVIEHLYQPNALAKAAHQLLKPEGVMILTTPYHGYLKNLVISILGRNDKHYDPLWDCGHIKFFSVKSITRLLTRQGFSNIKIDFYGRVPFLWKSMIVTAQSNRSRR